MKSFLATYIMSFAMIAVLGCDRQIFLTPESINSDDYSSTQYPSTNLIDNNPSKSWVGQENYEEVYYYFPTAIYVTEVYVQNMNNELAKIYVYRGCCSNMGWALNVSPYSDYSYRVQNSYLASNSYVKFIFQASTTTFLPVISAAYIFGCYVTSNPTSLPTTEGPIYFPSTLSPTPLTAQPTPSSTTSPIPLSVTPTVSPAFVEEVDGITIVLGKDFLLIAGAVLIICMAAFSVWLILRRSQRQKEVLKVLDISEKNAMGKFETTPGFRDELCTIEGRVKDADRGIIQLQLATVLDISDEIGISELETTPVIKDEFYFTEVGENNQRKMVRL